MQLRSPRTGPGRPAVAVFLAGWLIAGCGEGITEPAGPLQDPVLAAAIGTDPVTGASIETNKDDYVPGEVVHVEGRGWAPHETVRLHLVEEPDTHEDVTQDVVADEHGAFSTHLYDVEAHDIGVLFTLTATGLTSGSVAVTTFTDGTISGASIHFREGTCAAAVASVPVGTPICAFASFQITGAIDAETPVQFRWVNPNGVLAHVTPAASFPAGTSGAQTFSATFVPDRTGFWSVWLCESAGGGSSAACSGSSERAIEIFEVTEPTNTPPVLDPIPEQFVDEGSELTFTASASDSDSPAQALTFSLIDAPAGAVIDPSTGEFAWTPDDGPATVIFTVRVTDSGVPAMFAEREVTVTVDNVAPAITELQPANGTLVPVMTTVDVTALFDDPGTADTHTCAATATAEGAAAVIGTETAADAGSCTSSLLFEETGVYTVAFTVTDRDGGIGTGERMIVVFDPANDFVTGGGWIDSPAGAYLADPDLAGKAEFGFVSRYRKGATVPTGNTEFVLKTNGLNFQSTHYAWLIVNQNGGNAQFKGSGRLNGEEGYGFMIWAVDGSPDRFRIRIWEGDETNVVYDNGAGHAIGGGSIVIHTGGR